MKRGVPDSRRTFAESFIYSLIRDQRHAPLQGPSGKTNEQGDLGDTLATRRGTGLLGESRWLPCGPGGPVCRSAISSEVDFFSLITKRKGYGF